MKLPIPKDDDGKRMMMISGTSTGRKELICERRETSLIGGRAIQTAQFKPNMDLGSGDTSDYFGDIQNNYDSYNWDTRFDSHDFQPAQSSITKTYTPGSDSTPPHPLSTPPVGKTTSTSLESINKRVPYEDDRSDGDHLFKGKENHANATLAVVEDGKQQSFTANESNPTIPIPAEPSKTSTLRLSVRTRSESSASMERKHKIRIARAIFFKPLQESEDDIEKMDDTEQEAIIGHKTLYKTTTTTENSPNPEKMDKNGNRSEFEQNESDNDCVVQCLYYTIQCCECVIS